MTLRFMDGFESQDLLTKWNSAVVTPDFTGSTRFGIGSCLANGGGATAMQIVQAVTPSNRVYLGYASKITATQVMILASFYGDGGTVEHGRIMLTAAGAVTVNRAGTVLASSATGTIVANTWQYIETSCIISDTVGIIECKVNGSVVATFTGDTKNAGTSTNIDAVGVWVKGLSTHWIDDVYICDSLGSVNNTYLGDVRVQTLRPNAAGSSTQLLAVGGANYTNVDESPPSAADYNYSGTAGEKDLYGVEELLGGTTAVLGVQVGTVARKTDAGARAVKNLVKVGATTTAGASNTLGNNSLTYLTLHESNPTTAAAWAVGDIAALEIGVEVV